MNDQDTQLITNEVESGTYFSLARSWYSELFHTPIAQRSYYIVIILLSLVNVYFAITSFLGVFPIDVPVPFITFSNDLVEDIPRIGPISNDLTEDKNVSVMKYFIKSYVIGRESYDLSRFELRYRNIWSQSTKDVFEQYKKQIDASNPYSFYRLYTNQSRRLVEIVSLKYQHTKGKGLSHAQLVIECPVISLSTGKEESTSTWRVELTYNYTDFWVDQSLDSDNPIARFFGLTGSSLRASGERRKVVPMTFIVSDYTVKELLE